MNKEAIALVLTLALGACSQSEPASVHAAEGGGQPASEAGASGSTAPDHATPSAAGESMLDKAKGLASQVDLSKAREAFEQQLDTVGNEIDELQAEASSASGAAKESASELATRLKTRFAEAKQRYQDWKAQGGGDVQKLVSDLQPMLSEIQSDLDAALAKLKSH